MSKSAAKKERILAGLDIGSSKIVFVIGVMTNEGLDIVGVGQAPSSGIRQGCVVHIEETIAAINKAREEAELMSGYEAKEVWLGVSGNHVQSFDSKGMIVVKNKEVTSEEVTRVLDAARAVNVPDDRQVLHVLPTEYKVDDQAGVQDPVGMSGVRLEASVHIVTAGRTAIRNSIKCCERAGLKVQGLVLQSLASAMAVLSEDEKKLGIGVIDIGAGTCDIICFVHGSAALTAVVPVGGHHFTHDVAVGLRTPQKSAEEIKRKYGCALCDLIDGEEMIEVEGVGGRKARFVPKKYLSAVIEPRAEETLTLIREKLAHRGLFKHLGSGFVITGGGSQLQGLLEMGEFILESPLRRGYPDRADGLKDIVKNPSMATAVGLIMYAERQERARFNLQKNKEGESALLSGISQKVKEFFVGAN
jgi:cell division protein FtsA